jgi:hypothetical protein
MKRYPRLYPGLKTTGLLLSVAVVVGAGAYQLFHRQAPHPGAGQGSPQIPAEHLVGRWVRQLESGPVLYDLTLDAGGTMTMREYRGPDKAPSASAPATQPVLHHRLYDRDLPLAGEWTGQWSVQEGCLAIRAALSNGDPMVIRQKIERVTAVDLVLSSPNPAGKAQFKYERKD